MKKLEISILVILTITTLCVASAQAAQISVEPTYQDVFNGDTITVDIMVYPEESGIYGASYTLYFNSTLLNATLQTQGPFLTQDGVSPNIYKNEIYNNLGKVEYVECRLGVGTENVTGSGVLATITFDVIGEEGVSSLNISDLEDELLYSTSGPVLADINNGSVKIAQPSSSPFLVNGYIRYENGSKCDYSEINITNLNRSKEWPAKTIVSSNYYQIMLASGADVIAGETLQFNVISPDGSQWNITEHIVTQAEVDAGGFMYNITLDIHDNTPPTVTDNTPTGTDVPVTTVITVTFDEAMNTTSVEDALSTSPSVTGSCSWSGDTMTFTPDADLPYSTMYEVTIGTGAEDLAGNPLVAAYIWDFTTGSEQDNILIQLNSGWNLISLPLMPDDSNVNSVLSPISGNYSIVWAYNASDLTDHWKKYDPGVPFGNDLTTMELGKGYWIMMTSDDILNISGTMPAPTDIELWSGWNLIGYNSLNPHIITDALSSINGNYSIIWAYNGSDSTDHWKKYDPNIPFGNDLENMEPGNGYWIMMTTDDILEI